MSQVNKPLSYSEIWTQIPSSLQQPLIQGGTAAVASLFFGVATPAAATIFAICHSKMQAILQPGVKELLTTETLLPSRVYLFVVTLLMSSFICTSVSIALGFQISILASLVLSATLVPTKVAVEYLFRYFSRN